MSKDDSRNNTYCNLSKCTDDGADFVSTGSLCCNEYVLLYVKDRAQCCTTALAM
jgi:hypothetical protein